MSVCTTCHPSAIVDTDDADGAATIKHAWLQPDNKDVVEDKSSVILSSNKTISVKPATSFMLVIKDKENDDSTTSDSTAMYS